MSITRVDCQIFRGGAASTESSSFVVLNPNRKPGSLVVGGASAIRQGIGSQVACRLSIEHFVSGVLEYFVKGDAASVREVVPSDESETSLQVLENAFRKANSSVYEFGLKLAAGGRMSASLMGVVIEESSIAAARAGASAAYLYRNSELFPFFEPWKPTHEDPALGVYIGAQELVSVQLASVPMLQGDRLFIFSEALDSEQQQVLAAYASQLGELDAEKWRDIAERLFEKPEALPFAIAAALGPETIYLNHPI